jgi:hypothetical protein
LLLLLLLLEAPPKLKDVPGVLVVVLFSPAEGAPNEKPPGFWDADPNIALVVLSSGDPV